MSKLLNTSKFNIMINLRHLKEFKANPDQTTIVTLILTLIQALIQIPNPNVTITLSQS